MGRGQFFSTIVIAYLLLVVSPLSIARGEIFLSKRSWRSQATLPSLPSHDDYRPPKQLPKHAPGEVRIALRDGTLLTGKLGVKQLSVQTKYGVLTVPVDRLRRFTPGLDSQVALANEIKGLISTLGAAAMSEREKARKQLVGLGPSVLGELRKWRGSDKDDGHTERSKQMKKVIDQLEELDEEGTDEFSVPTAAWIHGDKIVTTTFTIVGRVSPKEFAFVSKYGPIRVSLADIRSIERDVDDKSKVSRTVQVEGKYLAQRGFRSSGIWLEPGDQVTIKAAGSITMTPWGKGKTSTPAGKKEFGWYVNKKIEGGALVGKIGGGEIVKLGAEKTFTAQRSGLLQFAIAMQQDYSKGNHLFPGSYSVHVRVTRAPEK
jgi:uncharacterized protein YdeI (BOF family)